MQAPESDVEQDVAGEVRRAEERAERSGKASVGAFEADDARVPQPDAAPHALQLAPLGAEGVPRPVHITTVWHRDHDARVATERDHWGTVSAAGLPSNVAHHGPRRDETGEHAQRWSG